ncbi:Chaperonin Cpn60/GroEL/TCP-1 family - like 10, partial [Theobroma cacao]
MSRKGGGSGGGRRRGEESGVLYLGNNCTTVIFKPPRTATYIIRTTLGARSMLKMLLDAAGGIVITIDGNAILRELDLAHPAAKAQYPTMLLYFIFFRSYNNALEDTIAVLDKIAMPIGFDSFIQLKLKILANRLYVQL